MIAIGIADDHPLVRRALRALFNRTAGYQILFEAQDGKQALDQTILYEPDVLLLDIHMPGMSGLDVLAELTTRPHRTRVLVISMLSDEDTVARAFKYGARGYVLKEDLPDELLVAIQKINDSEIYLSASLARQAAWHSDKP